MHINAPKDGFWLRLSGTGPIYLIQWLETQGVVFGTIQYISLFETLAEVTQYKNERVERVSQIDDLDGASVSDGTYVADVYGYEVRN